MNGRPKFREGCAAATFLLWGSTQQNDCIFVGWPAGEKGSSDTKSVRTFHADERSEAIELSVDSTSGCMAGTCTGVDGHVCMTPVRFVLE